QFEGKGQAKIGSREAVLGIIHRRINPLQGRGILQEVDVFPQADIRPIEPSRQEDAEVVIEPITGLKEIEPEVYGLSGAIPEISVIIRQGKATVIDQLNQPQINTGKRDAVYGIRFPAMVAGHLLISGMIVLAVLFMLILFF